MINYLTREKWPSVFLYCWSADLGTSVSICLVAVASTRWFMVVIVKGEGQGKDAEEKKKEELQESQERLSARRL